MYNMSITYFYVYYILYTYIHIYINKPPLFPYRSAPFPVAVGNTVGMGCTSNACPFKLDRNN